MTATWMFPDPPNVAVLTTRSIVYDGVWIAHVSHDEDDGCWQFHDSRLEGPQTADAMVVGLGEMVTRDPTLNALADLPIGWRAWREAPTAPWQRAPAA